MTEPSGPFATINGVGFSSLNDAFERLRELWSEWKAPAVAEQLRDAENKGKVVIPDELPALTEEGEE